MTMTHAARLTDAALAEKLLRLAAGHRHTTAELVAHLAEFDARKLHLSAGHPSLFAYCTAVLHLSEHEAYHRIEAARDVRRFPMLLDGLRQGSLTLTTLRLLAPHLTPENHAGLLAAAAGKGKQDVLDLLAQWFPRPDVAASVRKVATRSARATRSDAPPAALALAVESVAASTAAVASAADGRSDALAHTSAATDGGSGVVRGGPSGRGPVVAPLSADRYEIRFTASRGTRDKLQRAQALLSHAVPRGDVAEIVDRALDLLVAALEKRTFGAADRPREVHRPPKPLSRHIPAEVRRAVERRDGRQCTFVSADGRRCGTSSFLQFHHVVPYGVGGTATPGNIQLRCGAHNRHEARSYYARLDVVGDMSPGST